MPNGRIHTVITLTTLPLMTLAGQSIGLDPVKLLIGGAIGLLITPDLDVDGGNISMYYVRQVSPPLSMLWRLIWWPYSRIMPHRSIWSHLPVLSTLIRLGYLMLLANLIWGAFVWFTKGSWSPVFFWDWTVFLGLAQADLWHALADHLQTSVRKYT